MDFKYFLFENRLKSNTILECFTINFNNINQISQEYINNHLILFEFKNENAIKDKFISLEIFQ